MQEGDCQCYSTEIGQAMSANKTLCQKNVLHIKRQKPLKAVLKVWKKIAKGLLSSVLLLARTELIFCSSWGVMTRRFFCIISQLMPGIGKRVSLLLLRRMFLPVGEIVVEKSWLVFGYCLLFQAFFGSPFFVLHLFLLILLLLLFSDLIALYSEWFLYQPMICAFCAPIGQRRGKQVWSGFSRTKLGSIIPKPQQVLLLTWVIVEYT